MNSKGFLLFTIILNFQFLALAQIENHSKERGFYIYNLTEKEEEAALKGWDLYQKKKFSSAYNGGHFTNPVELMLGYEFWSNGKVAILNFDKKNHCENFFLVKGEKLSYFGTVGFNGDFIHLAFDYQKHIKKSLSYNSPNGLFLKLYFSDKNPQDSKVQSKLSYIFNDQVAIATDIGWGLYKMNKRFNSPHDGHYVFSYIDKKGFGFWSDGKTAKVDRNNDGHYETLFRVKNDSLVYIGSFEMKDNFVQVTEKFQQLIKRSK